MSASRTDLPATRDRRVLFLANERARDGKVLAALRKHTDGPLLAGTDTRVAPFIDDAGARRGLASLSPGEIPVVAGGDGTVTWMARILRESGLQDRPMGVMPLGTGNGLAHSLGIRSPRQAVEAVLLGEPVDLDLMTTTHPQAPVSLLCVSVGLEAMVMAEFAARRSRSRLLAGLVGCGQIRRRLSGVHITADDEPLLDGDEPVCNAGLYNMPCYGFGVRPRPAADPADGAADLRLHRSRTQYAAYIAAAVVGAASPLNPHPAWPRVRRATISSPWPVQIDGESVAPARFEVNVVPGGLRVLAPAAASTASTAAGA